MTSQRPQLWHTTVFDLLCITEAVEVFFRCKKKIKSLMGSENSWHFQTIGGAGALAEGNLQEINLEAEGKPETCLQRIGPQLFACFPWKKKMKSPNQMAATQLLTPDLGVFSYSRISTVFIIVDAAFIKHWKNVKTLSVFHISLPKKGLSIQQFQHFSSFWLMGSSPV